MVFPAWLIIFSMSIFSWLLVMAAIVLLGGCRASVEVEPEDLEYIEDYLSEGDDDG